MRVDNQGHIYMIYFTYTNVYSPNFTFFRVLIIKTHPPYVCNSKVMDRLMIAMIGNNNYGQS